MASLKALLVSAGAVFIAVVALGVAVPSISGRLGPRPPTALGWFRSWFRPLYPFVVVNVIIAAIAATSRCSRRAQPGRPALAVTVGEKMEIMEVTPAAAEAMPAAAEATPAAAEAFDEFKDFEEKRVVVVAAGGNGRESGGGDGYNGDCEGERKVAFRRSRSRKAAGGDRLQGGKAETGVGAMMSATRRVKVDGTDYQISLPEPPSPPPPPSMQKSATFEDRTAQQPPLSPIKSSEDDLNHQFEAFINKIKRLQRQESVNQYE